MIRLIFGIIFILVALNCMLCYKMLFASRYRYHKPLVLKKKLFLPWLSGIIFFSCCNILVLLFCEPLISIIVTNDVWNSNIFSVFFPPSICLYGYLSELAFFSCDLSLICVILCLITLLRSMLCFRSGAFNCHFIAEHCCHLTSPDKILLNL